MQSIRSVDSQIAVNAPIFIFKCCFIGRYASKVPGISTASSSIGRSISVTISPLVKDKIGEPTFCGFCKTSADRNSHSVVQYKFRSVKIACVIKIKNYSTVAHKKSFVVFKQFAELRKCTANHGGCTVAFVYVDAVLKMFGVDYFIQPDSLCAADYFYFYIFVR